MEKIWKELRQLNMTKRKVRARKPRPVLDRFEAWREYRIPESIICTPTITINQPRTFSLYEGNRNEYR